MAEINQLYFIVSFCISKPLFLTHLNTSLSLSLSHFLIFESDHLAGDKFALLEDHVFAELSCLVARGLPLESESQFSSLLPRPHSARDSARVHRKLDDRLLVHRVVINECFDNALDFHLLQC